MGKTGNSERIVVGKTCENRTPLERLEERWEDNTKIYLREVDGRWMLLAQKCAQWLSLVMAVLNIPV
jgi:hypothetical protein